MNPNSRDFFSKEVGVTISNAAWFAAGTCADIVDGQPCLLVIRYRIVGSPAEQIKFPGGKQREVDGRLETTPEATLRREFPEEALEEPSRLTKVESVHRQQKSADHFQEFFLVEFRGDLRKHVLMEREDGRSAELLGEPEYMPVTKLLRVLFPSHRQALVKIVRLMASRHAAWAWVAKEINEEGGFE